MTREEASEWIIGAINHKMRDTHDKMLEHPALGYGTVYDRLEEAKEYLEKNLK
jgi:hypothetical protein